MAWYGKNDRELYDDFPQTPSHGDVRKVINTEFQRRLDAADVRDIIERLLPAGMTEEDYHNQWSRKKDLEDMTGMPYKEIRTLPPRDPPKSRYDRLIEDTQP